MQKLRHRIKLEQLTETQDSAGQVSRTWSEYRTCFADVKESTGREQMLNDRQMPIVAINVWMRYPRGGRFPEAHDRVVYRETTGRTRYLNIDSIVQAGTGNRKLKLVCKEDLN